MNEINKPIVRFAPSPTGPLHLGSARSALFNYLFAKKYGGKYILRIEDTDRQRSTKEFEANIFESFKWLNLNHDELYKQSERVEIYKKYLKQLVDSGHAYVSKEKQINEGDRAEVIRFKNPNKKILFHDLIKGDIEFDTTELGDFVIAKDFNEPLYHLAVVVDDFEMKITHVIRGEDHVSNTPRQILIQEAIGAPRPAYAHIPIILDTDKSKLSKRKHGEKVAVTHYRDLGYLPDALINFLCLLGWNPGDDRELFTLEELISVFSLEKVQKSAAIWNLDKLDWINREYIKKIPAHELVKLTNEALQKINIKGDNKIIAKIEPNVRERITTLKDIDELAKNGELSFYFEQPAYDVSSLLWKGKGDYKILAERLEKVIQLILTISPTDFSADKIKESVWDYATEVGRGEILWPVRYILSGKEKSPDPFFIASIIGKDVTVKRLRDALKLVQEK